MALGDGLAGLIGRQLKTPQWIIFKQTKSIGGTATMAMVSILVLMILSNVTSHIISLPIAIAIGLGATGLEQISMRGLDNLTVPLGVGLTWSMLIPQRHKHHKKLCLQILQFASSTRLKLLLRSPNSVCQIIQNLFCCFKADASIGNALSVGELR